MTPGARSSSTHPVLAAVHWTEDLLLALLLGTIVLLAPLQIVLRNFFDAGWLWADPFLRVLVLWVALLGALAASRQDKQISIDVVSKFLSPRAKAVVGVLTGLFTTLVCTVVAYHSWLFVAAEREFGSTAFGEVPAWLCEAVIPFAFAMIALRHLGRALAHGGVALGTAPPPARTQGGKT